MAKFREFYVQAGAGSNFLASKCLWANTLDGNTKVFDENILTNEYYYHREKVNDISLSAETYIYDPFKSKDLEHKTKEIRPTLIDISLFINSIDFDEHNSSNRSQVILNVLDLWKKDWSMYTTSFFNFRYFIQTELSEEIKDLMRLAEDYFAQCREYYYNMCEKNDYDSFVISHQHPHYTISPRLITPLNFETLSMKIDPEIDIFIEALQDIKHSHRQAKDNYTMLNVATDDLFLNRSVKLSDDKVSYRKIFFENNEDEIRKMYDFFDNEDYFDENKVQIMSEFRQYHDKNMSVIQKFIPNLYSKLNG